MRLYRDDDANSLLLRGRQISVIGYDNRGRPQGPFPFDLQSDPNESYSPQ